MVKMKIKQNHAKEKKKKKIGSKLINQLKRFVK